jgi:hypothetical protein
VWEHVAVTDDVLVGCELSYSGFGKVGIEFAEADGACGLASLQGILLPRDLRISTDILLPPATEGGAFFRAHRVRPGEPIEGSAFGGVWVRLHSTGEVTVHSLSHSEDRSVEPIAKGLAVVRSHPSAWRHLDAEVRGMALRVWVDGDLVRFTNSLRSNETVPVPMRSEGAAGMHSRRHLDPPIPFCFVESRSASQRPETGLSLSQTGLRHEQVEQDRTPPVRLHQ